MLLLLLSSLAAVAACKEKTADKPKALDAGAASALPPPAPGSEEEAIANEAKKRPAIPFTVEKVVAAIDGAGVPTEDNRAVLAAEVNARYCRNVRVPAYTIVLVICEYATPEEAAKGREVSLEKYRGQPGRETFVNGATMLTVVLKREGKPSTDEWGKKIIEAFQNMK